MTDQQERLDWDFGEPFDQLAEYRKEKGLQAAQRQERLAELARLCDCGMGDAPKKLHAPGCKRLTGRIT